MQNQSWTSRHIFGPQWNGHHLAAFNMYTQHDAKLNKPPPAQKMNDRGTAGAADFLLRNVWYWLEQAFSWYKSIMFSIEAQVA